MRSDLKNCLNLRKICIVEVGGGVIFKTVVVYRNRKFITDELTSLTTSVISHNPGLT